MTLNDLEWLAIFFSSYAALPVLASYAQYIYYGIRIALQLIALWGQLIKTNNRLTYFISVLYIVATFQFSRTLAVSFVMSIKSLSIITAF